MKIIRILFSILFASFDVVDCWFVFDMLRAWRLKRRYCDGSQLSESTNWSSDKEVDCYLTSRFLCNYLYLDMKDAGLSKVLDKLGKNTWPPT